MKEIVEYTDYRKYIQDYYDERKRCSAFSWQEFARNAGFSSAVFLKYVCEGKKNLSIGSAGSVANAMGLAGYEQAYFVLILIPRTRRRSWMRSPSSMSPTNTP